jgi:acetoin utilization deacetylase AcuC-like enzyme
MTTAFITHPRCVEHDIPGHPERPDRLRAVWDVLETSGLAARLTRLEPEPATDEQILLVHTPAYLDVLKSISVQDRLARFDADTYALPVSPEIARLSAGGAALGVDVICGGRADHALVAVRPPGHHAIPTRGMGFCLLGNIAIAARHAQKVYGVGRVLIVDYDVHHGNGTQDMFYDDPSVLFISTHQYPYYPGSGALTDTGAGKGIGATINIPLAAGNGDRNYAALFDQIVWPAARRFQPELILVSAGFDAHWIDPLASMRLTLSGYAHITRELLRMADALCGGKTLFLMEGGYDLEAISYGMANIARVLLRETDIDDPLGGARGAEPNIDPLIAQVRALHDLG